MRICGQERRSDPKGKPSNAAGLTPHMVKYFQKLPKELQMVARDAFSKFDFFTIQELAQTDLSISFARPELGGAAGGLFNQTRNSIELYVDKDSTKHAEAYLIHELVHAIDRLKYKKQAGLVKNLLIPASDGYVSRQDPELTRLHLDYAKRTLPGVGQHLADFARSNPTSQGKSLVSGAREYDWSITEGELQLQEKNKALRYLETTLPTLAPGLVSGVLGAAAILVGVSAGATLVGGAIGLPLVAFGLRNLGSSVRAVQDERALVGHQTENVKVTAHGMNIKIDQPLPSDAQPTTDYATLSRRPEEYLAESMTEYLRSKESRDSLRQRDPAIFEYCAGWNIAAED